MPQYSHFYGVQTSPSKIVLIDVDKNVSTDWKQLWS